MYLFLPSSLFIVQWLKGEYKVCMLPVHHSRPSYCIALIQNCNSYPHTKISSNPLAQYILELQCGFLSNALRTWRKPSLLTNLKLNYLPFKYFIQRNRKPQTHINGVSRVYFLIQFSYILSRSTSSLFSFAFVSYFILIYNSWSLQTA